MTVVYKVNISQLRTQQFRITLVETYSRADSNSRGRGRRVSRRKSNSTRRGSRHVDDRRTIGSVRGGCGGGTA